MRHYDEPDDEGTKLLVWGSVVALIVAISLIVFLGGFSRIVGREFSKFDEETRRQVHTESQTYQEGMAQNLDRLCLEWDRTGKKSMAYAISHRVSGYTGELPDHIQECVDKAQEAR